MFVTKLPYGGGPVRAPPIMDSQATVNLNTKDQAMLRGEHNLKQGKGKCGCKRNGIAHPTSKTIVIVIPY